MSAEWNRGTSKRATQLLTDREDELHTGDSPPTCAGGVKPERPVQARCEQATAVEEHLQRCHNESAYSWVNDL